MKCKICQEESNFLLKGTILGKYEISYFKCAHCGFIQTEDPYWLQEAYATAIANTDTGYVTRNLYYSEIVRALIKLGFDKRKQFLDYGGGYGLFVRLMRDKGIAFYRQDLYCENIFARSFDVSDVPPPARFELLTAFEVFEHLDQPLDELEKMFSYSDSILFSTELQPDKTLSSVQDWWYFAPHMGQHISLFSLNSLHFIARKFRCQLYSNKRNLHLLTRKKFMVDPIKVVSLKQNFLDKAFSRHFHRGDSLIQPDSENARNSRDT